MLGGIDEIENVIQETEDNVQQIFMLLTKIEKKLKEKKK